MLAASNACSGNKWAKIGLGIATSVVALTTMSYRLNNLRKPDVDMGPRALKVSQACLAAPIAIFYIFSGVFTGDDESNQKVATGLNVAGLVLALFKLGLDFKSQVMEDNRRHLEENPVNRDREHEEEVQRLNQAIQQKDQIIADLQLEKADLLQVQQTDQAGPSKDPEIEPLATIGLHYRGSQPLAPLQRQLPPLEQTPTYFSVSNTEFLADESRANQESNSAFKHLFDHNYSMALSCIKESMTVNTRLQRKAGLAVNHIMKGQVYARLSRIKITLDLKAGMASNLAHLGVAYQDNGESTDAITMFRQARLLDKQLKNNSIGAANNSSNLGNALYLTYEASKNINNLDEAISCHDEACVINNNLKAYYGVATNNANLGLLYMAKTKYTEAENCFKKAENYFRDNKYEIKADIIREFRNQVKSLISSQNVPKSSDSPEKQD